MPHRGPTWRCVLAVVLCPSPLCWAGLGWAARRGTVTLTVALCPSPLHVVAHCRAVSLTTAFVATLCSLQVVTDVQQLRAFCTSTRQCWYGYWCVSSHCCHLRSQHCIQSLLSNAGAGAVLMLCWCCASDIPVTSPLQCGTQQHESASAGSALATLLTLVSLDGAGVLVDGVTGQPAAGNKACITTTEFCCSYGPQWNLGGALVQT